jgi:phage terminase small subunit
MWNDEERKKRQAKEDLERQQAVARRREEIRLSNELLKAPPDLSEEERIVWEEIATLISLSTRYEKTAADTELLRQYVQTKLLRDRAWAEYNKNPERYMRIVTGMCADGQTPKLMVRENEHYKTLADCNKQLEKLLKHFMLTPAARS